MKSSVVYSATVPLGMAPMGKASANAKKVLEGMGTGIIPFFVSGPMSRTDTGGISWQGWIGTALHVAAWLVAIIMDAVSMTNVDETTQEVAWTVGLASIIVLSVGLFFILACTAWNLCATGDNIMNVKNTAPFVLTFFTGGAAASLLLSVLTFIGLVTCSSGVAIAATCFADPNIKLVRELQTTSIVAKVFICHFLQNNIAWTHMMSNS